MTEDNTLSVLQFLRYRDARRAGLIGRLWCDSELYRLAPASCPGGLTGNGGAIPISFKDLNDTIDRCFPSVDISVPRKPVNREFVHETWRELLRRA